MTPITKQQRLQELEKLFSQSINILSQKEPEKTLGSLQRVKRKDLESLSDPSISSFAYDIDQGLSKENKTIPLKYFYNAEGMKIFKQLNDHPDYYLSKAESEVLKNHASDIAKLMPEEDFDLIELGPGNAEKTELLLSKLDKHNFTYIPIDISKKATDNIKTKFKERFPKLTVETRVGDYFKVLELRKKEKPNKEKKQFLMYFGTTIGNGTNEDRLRFMKQTLKSTLKSGDRVLIGFDLIKDKEVIMKAYDNETAAPISFNLIDRINDELNGNFDKSKLKALREFNKKTNTLEMYIVSTEDQDIEIKALNKSFHLKEGEKILHGQSKKFSMKEIENLAKESGFKIVENFFDEQKYCVNSVLEVI